MVSNEAKQRKQRFLALSEGFMRFIDNSREKHTFGDILVFKKIISNKKEVVVSQNFDMVLMAFIFLCQKKTLIVSSHINSFKFRQAAKKYLNHDCSISTILDVASDFNVQRPEYSRIVWDRVIYYDVPQCNNIKCRSTIECHVPESQTNSVCL